MSTLNADRLYALLPALYRIRDEQQGHPLRDLVGLIAREVEALEENVEQLYDDQFIETCDDWVAPYIGDLIGYRPLQGVAAAIASPRAEVANTIGYRRRKGTAAMLEQLAHDVTDWPARAVEFFEQLATTQYMKHVRLHAPASADLRSTVAMRQQGGPFNRVARTAEMRRPEAGSGRYNIPNIGIFLWRLQPFRLSDVPLTADPLDASGRKFRFNPLGADQPLFRRPLTETQVTHIAEPVNVPDPIDLRLMAIAVKAAMLDATVACDYGIDTSLLLSRPNADPSLPPVPIPLAEICICDLRDVPGGWAHEATLAAGKISIDPTLGRVLLGSALNGTVLGTCHTGFSRPIGGGEYGRSLDGETLPVQRNASASEALQPDLDAIAAGGRLVIDDSVTYTQTPVFKVDGVPDETLPAIEVVVTAHDGKRPLIAASGPIALEIGARGTLVLEGLVISGGALRLAAPAAGDVAPRHLVLRHCTLVPGLVLNVDGSAASPGAPSLVVENPFAIVRLEQCIVGALRIAGDATLTLVDCIVDAGAPDAIALEGIATGAAGAAISVTDSTVIGKVHVRLMTLASNTIFFAQLSATDPWKAPVQAERKQQGCVRFSVVPAGSLVPRRFHCVPDDAHPSALPQFTSLRYGDPAYAQLRSTTDRAIREGADDGGEIGVMHPLHQPQRESNLRIRLDEYLRFGLHAGIFYVT
ncbi:MAG: hypothetical protein ABI781_16245 [Burkholderiales bacterium]